MNFSFSEDQQAIRESVARIFKDLCTDDAIKVLSKSDSVMHRALWTQLSESGILGLPFAEAHGGMGMGLLELCQIIELQGKSVAPIPLISSVVESAMTIAESDNAGLQERVLPEVIAGELILSPARPYQGIQSDEDLIYSRGELTGRSGFVPYAAVAQAYVVQAHDENGEAVLLYCPADREGLQCIEQTAITDEPAGYLRFSSVKLDDDSVLARGASAEQLIAQQHQRAYVALAALQIGALEEGLRRTAEYVSERKQFGRSLGSFQAVSQQAADAYMEIEALRSVYWRALDEIQSGDDFSSSAAVTKYWVAEAGHKAAHIILHLHGGIGQDLDYPIHRYFLFAKHCERYLGGADEMSAQLGAKLMQTKGSELEQMCL